MKHEYESWEEVADDLCDGGYLFHQADGHHMDLCYGWQRGVRSTCALFARMGCPVPDYDVLWENAINTEKDWK